MRMRYPVTLAFTLFGAALCLFNYSGYDPHNVFLFMFSVPIWFVELFSDIHRVNVWLMYLLTLISYALIGYLADLGIARLRTWKHM
ncbi:hypothetical protein [Cohnella sp. CFH 77786]|uniref:hypothetical protein n=1 Tax=Cohnella sp. CFH 77786 TaxID=2662265 RepID=UPI00210266E5|nr:hypothetical protein [Cohnella sp. CFH 77786]